MNKFHIIFIAIFISSCVPGTGHITNSDELKFYLDRVERSARFSEYGWHIASNILNNSDIRRPCFAKLMHDDGYFFVTLNPDRTTSDVRWHPKDKEAQCLKKYFLGTDVLPRNIKAPEKPIHFFIPLMEPQLTPLPQVIDEK